MSYSGVFLCMLALVAKSAWALEKTKRIDALQTQGAGVGNLCDGGDTCTFTGAYCAASNRSTEKTCQCNPGFTQYLGPGGYIRCAPDLALGTCNNHDVCPSIVGLTYSSEAKCVCQPVTGPNGWSKSPAVLTTDPSTGEGVCAATNIGSSCTENNQCPRNAYCKGNFGSKQCSCRPFHKLVGLEGNVNGCEVSIGSACATPSDCGALAYEGLYAPGMVCGRPSFNSTIQVCMCPRASSWNPDEIACSAICKAML